MIDTTLPLTDIHATLMATFVPRPFLNLAASINLASCTIPGNTDSPRSGHCQEPDLVSFLTKLDWGVKVLASLMPVAAWHLKTLKMQPVTASLCRAAFFTRLHGNGTSAACAGVVEAVIDGVREGCRTFGVRRSLSAL